MHRRCCCPPESDGARTAFSLSFTSSHSAAARRLRSTISSSSCRLRLAGQRQAGDHVLVDRHHRERVRASGTPCRCAAARGPGRPPARRCPRRRVGPARRRARRGTTSCMRFRQRSAVDLPQPEGPMIAVTWFGRTLRLTSRIAMRSPYQAERCSAHIVGASDSASGAATTGSASCMVLLSRRLRFDWRERSSNRAS